MKKILFVVPFPPPVHGSSIVSQYIKESETIRQTFSCDFVNSSTSRKLEEIGKTKPIKFFRYIASNLTICWKLMTHKYDLCYLAITCHGRGFLKDAPFVLLCKLFGIKVVIHQHNKGMDQYIDQIGYNKLLKLTYKNTKVILLSWYLYPDIEKIVKKDQILICPNGIPELTSEFPANRKSNLVPQLLFLSNLFIAKGVLVLLDACKILKEKGYSYTCYIIGGETEEINMERLMHEIDIRELNDRIFYQGKKFNNEKHEFFKTSDIFVFPTCNETFGLVNLEAMQFKIPIISTNEGGIPDVVEDGTNGLICEKNNSESLASKIGILLTNPCLREQMGENGYKIYKEKFTQKAFETTLVNNLKTVLGL